MEDYHGKWDKSRDKSGRHKDEGSSAKDEVRPEYEEYLMLLQQRNRLLKKLKTKDEQQIELEKKEQGFSIYVNGANVELGQGNLHAKSRSTSRHSKTAGDAYHERKRLLQHELQNLEREAEARDIRVKTAPDQDLITRKGWNYDSIQIRTDEGKKLKLKAPGKLTGKYSEDFESFAIDGYNSASDQDDLNDQEEDPDDDDDDDDNKEMDELSLSFNDVETLRKSLEADESIRESIQAAQNRLQEEKTEPKYGDGEDEDDDDEIDEELEGANDSLNLLDKTTLARLPQLTSTVSDRGGQVASPIGHSQDIDGSGRNSRSIEIQNDLNVGDLPIKRKKDQTESGKDLSAPVHVDVKEKKANERKAKNENVLKNSGEDLIVLSFSSSGVKRKERMFSATRRKTNADEYDSEDLISSKCGTTKDGTQHNRLKKEVTQGKDLQPASVYEKKSRPLSATRKSEAVDKLDDNAEEIFKAMAEENQSVESKASGSKTAPERTKQYCSNPPLSEVKRPSSVTSSSSFKTDDTIALVTEKVRKMDARQQQHLIRLLAKLEYKAPLKGSSDSPWPQSSPLKATEMMMPSKSSDFKEGGQSEDYSIVDSLDTFENRTDNDYGTDVYFEILSNWGNPDNVGLTEIQFFDLDSNLISYESQNVSISGHVGEEGDLGNLANGKTKTTKGRYMWYCGFQGERPVELVFHLPNAAEGISSGSHGLSKIVVWNYNRGIKELNVGAKDVRIFVGGELVWEGIIDKGCGNQVFDYCQVINLLPTLLQSEHGKDIEKDPEPIIRSETVVLRRSVDAEKREIVEGEENNQQVLSQLAPRCKTVLLTSAEKVDQENELIDVQSQPGTDKPDSKPVEHQKIPKPPELQRTHPRSPRTHGRPLSTEESKVSKPVHEHVRLKEKAMKSLLTSEFSSSTTGKIKWESALASRSNSTPNLSSSQTRNSSESLDDSVRGNAAAISTLPSKPPWLESNKKKSKCGSPTRSSLRSKSRPMWLGNDAGIDRGRSSSLSDVQSSSGISSSKQTSEETSVTPSASSTLDPWPSKFESKNESLPSCLDDVATQTQKQSRSGSGRRKVEVEQDDSPSTCQNSSTHDAKTTRATWRKQQNLSLEESWSLLSLFEKKHRGRITQDLDLEHHDDALDELIPKTREISESVEEQAQGEKQSLLIDLEIPTLPKGRQLTVNIRNTWGDRHYVGLNGIEVFTECGKPAEIAEICADPSDINILPEYGNDPRVVTNLIDGIYRTRDDMHLWLAPFTPGGKHIITLTFAERLKIAMIRIWNYNKSRIHSFRGVRFVDITLDDNLIFQGEIARASGILGPDDPFGDTILFTMDEEILEAMAQYDQTYDGDAEAEDELLRSCYFERPSTADLGEDGGSGDRPFTSARQHNKNTKRSQDIIQECEEDGVPSTNNFLEGRVLQLNFVSTWGDPYYMGLTGLDVLGPNMEIIPLSHSMLKALPADLNDLPEYEDDDRTLDKLIDGTNVTTSDEHMWLIPFTEGQDHLLTIDLGQFIPLIGLRVWNYNKSTDDSFRGAKQVHVNLDDQIISPPEGFLLRKGPGNVHFDHGQDVYFIKSPKENPAAGDNKADTERRSVSKVNLKKLMPDYEPTIMPCGFVFQFQLFSTWGDPYYIGLNGLEFYDENGYKIRLIENNVTAYPHSVNVLEGVTDDVRTPDKLIDGVNDTQDGRHMWLAPILPGMVNLIYVVFDEPVTVSMVKVWNYSKTPIRGVQQFGLLVDNLLVYHGILPQVPAVTRGILPNLDMPIPHHTVLFTDQEQIALAERKNVLSNKGGEQDIQLTNDKRIVSHYSDSKSVGKTADPALRPKTSVPALQKKR